MKKILLILSYFILTLHLVSGQTFDLTSTKFEVGDEYVSNPKIFFDFAKCTIKQDSYSYLDSIAHYFIKHNNLIIEIGTHSDSRVSHESSQILTQKRSESITEYLINKGVSSNRLIAKGYEDYNLLIKDDEIKKMKTEIEKEKAHSKNRRTGFKIISIEN